MRRLLALGIALLVIGVVGYGARPSPGWTVLVVAGLTLLAVLAFAIQARARRSPGWTRVVRPGAAYREARRERMAGRREHGEGAAGTPTGPPPRGGAP